MTFPIFPIRALWQRQRPEEAREQTAEAMTRAPHAALTQVGDLLVHINNDGHAYGLGYASGSALEAGVQLEKIVKRGLAGAALSREEFASLLVHVGQLEQDARRQLRTATTEGAVRELQKTLDQTVRLRRFLPPETG